MSTAEWDVCGTCGGEFVIKRNGTMRQHKGDRWWGGRRQMCEGTGKPPRAAEVKSGTEEQVGGAA